MKRSRSLLLVAIALVIFAGSAGLIAWKLWPRTRVTENAPQPPITPPKAPKSEESAQPSVRGASTIIDLPGDPLIVRRAIVGAPRETKFTLPVALAAAAPKTETPGYFLNAPLVSSAGGYMGKYSSSGGEAAAAAAQLAYNAAVANSGAADAAAEASDDDGGAETPADAAAQMLTADNSNQVEISIIGRPTRQESILKTVVAVKISELLISNGYSAESARAVEAATKEIFKVQTLPPAGAALAYGTLDTSGDYRVDQFAIWEDHEYVGAVAVSESGLYTEAARPRAPEGLLDDAPVAQAPTQYTLADGVYSAGLRNGVPEGIIREAVELMTGLTDLKGSLAVDENLRLLYTRDIRTKGKARARVIYVGLQGGAGGFDCYAYEGSDGAYLCFDPKGGAFLKFTGGGGGGGGGTSGSGLIAPIKGAPITSLFGMRFHPILHILRLHGGIDFGAPVGSQVRAAADGKIEIAAEVQGFGNHIRMQNQGFETSYSHLSQIPAEIHPGVEVKQGDVIALSGNTGLSTGPHLHFEYYQGGQVSDPLPHLTAELQASAAGLVSQEAAQNAGTPAATTTGPASTNPAPTAGGHAVIETGHPTQAEKAAFPAFKTAVDSALDAAAKQ